MTSLSAPKLLTLSRKFLERIRQDEAVAWLFKPIYLLVPGCDARSFKVRSELKRCPRFRSVRSGLFSSRREWAWHTAARACGVLSGLGLQSFSLRYPPEGYEAACLPCRSRARL